MKEISDHLFSAKYLVDHELPGWDSYHDLHMAVDPQAARENQSVLHGDVIVRYANRSTE